MAGKDRQSPSGNQARSGTGGGGDPTLMHGQYPDSIFGMAVPQTSGAKGSSGSHEEAGSVNQPGQYPGSDPFSGVGFPQGTGAPGTQGRMAGDQPYGPSTMSTDVGSTIYGNTVEDHALDSDPARPDGYYPFDGEAARRAGADQHRCRPWQRPRPGQPERAQVACSGCRTRW